jgi:hypothetical protein
MIDSDGNVVFDIPADGFLNDVYFFYENSNGNYVISASYIDNSIILRGVLFGLTKDGTGTWLKVFDRTPTWVLLSVQEMSDGYLFSGFNSGSLLLTGVDWRTSFLQEEHNAVLLKTGLSGVEQWSKIINSPFFTAGALTVGSSPFTIFGGKYDRSVKNIFLLKLNNTGEIYN